MTSHLAAYLAGVLTATVVLLWALARLTVTPEAATVPRDSYVERLGAWSAPLRDADHALHTRAVFDGIVDAFLTLPAGNPKTGRRWV